MRGSPARRDSGVKQEDRKRKPTLEADRCQRRGGGAARGKIEEPFSCYIKMRQPLSTMRGSAQTEEARLFVRANNQTGD